MKKIISAFLLVLALGASVSAVSAQTSAAAQGPIRRGEGAAAISGYLVSDLSFRLDPEASLLEEVSFVLDAPASWAAVQFDRPSWVSFDCNSADEVYWSCPLEGVRAIDVRQITVSAGR